MERRPTALEVKRRRLEESSDEDDPVDKSRASIPPDDDATQGSQTLEESSEILGESQYDDGIADDDAVPQQATQASTPSEDDGSQGDPGSGTDDDVESPAPQITPLSPLEEAIHDEDDYRFILYGREEQRVDTMISNGQIIFLTGSIRFQGNNPTA